MKSLTFIAPVILAVPTFVAALISGPPIADGGGGATTPYSSGSACNVTPKTEESCWDCLQEMYDACKGRDQDIRRACLDAANRRYEWCLERVRGRVHDVVSVGSDFWGDSSSWDLLSEWYVITIPELKETDEIGVFYFDDAGMVAWTGFEVFEGYIAISSPRAIYDNEDAILLVVKSTGTATPLVLAGGAVPLVNSPDVNRDGAVDMFDAIEAMNQLSAGIIDKPTAYRLIRAISLH